MHQVFSKNSRLAVLVLTFNDLCCPFFKVKQQKVLNMTLEKKNCSQIQQWVALFTLPINLGLLCIKYCVMERFFTCGDVTKWKTDEGLHHLHFFNATATVTFELGFYGFWSSLRKESILSLLSPCMMSKSSQRSIPTSL